MKVLIASPWLQYVICLAGMFIHFLKKNVTGETFTDVTSYFKDHPKNTLIAVVVTTIIFFGYQAALVTGTSADLVGVFMLGYTFDSVFNKYEGVK